MVKIRRHMLPSKLFFPFRYDTSLKLERRVNDISFGEVTGCPFFRIFQRLFRACDLLSCAYFPFTCDITTLARFNSHTPRLKPRPCFLRWVRVYSVPPFSACLLCLSADAEKFYSDVERTNDKEENNSERLTVLFVVEMFSYDFLPWASYFHIIICSARDIFFPLYFLFFVFLRLVFVLDLGRMKQLLRESCFNELMLC